MPFIRGRYHMNPVLGEALEAAREAEAALSELEQEAQQSGDASGTSDSDAADPARQPVHRVEIEAAEKVPSHTGHAKRGFVARVHRQPAGASGAADPDGDGYEFASSPAHRFLSHHSRALRFRSAKLFRKPKRTCSPATTTCWTSCATSLLGIARSSVPLCVFRGFWSRMPARV
jgi:hypothetical protein